MDLPDYSASQWLLAVLALTVPGPLGSIAGAGRCAHAQEANSPPGDERVTRGLEPKRVQSITIRPPSGTAARRGSDRAKTERLFGASERLMRGLEPKRVQSITIRPPWPDGATGR